MVAYLQVKIPPHRYDFELFDYDIQEYLQVARPDEAESPAGTKN